MMRFYFSSSTPGFFPSNPSPDIDMTPLVILEFQQVKDGELGKKFEAVIPYPMSFDFSEPFIMRCYDFDTPEKNIAFALTDSLQTLIDTQIATSLKKRKKKS